MLELQSLIEQELETNPTLDASLDAPDPLESLNTEEKPLKPGEEPYDAAFDKEFEMLAQLDTEWRDSFRMDSSNLPFTRDDEARREHFMNSISQEDSLQVHLLKQLAMTDLTPAEMKIGELLIGNINDDGYFNASIEELAAATGESADHIENMLLLIQEFNPIGVGARNLEECLMLQLERKGLTDDPIAEVVQHYLGKLAAKKLPEIAKALKISVEEVQEIGREIATLEPKPGRMFSSETATYVLPEVIVTKVDGEYIITVNNDQVPHLHISNHYRQLMENPNTPPETKKYIREKIQAGKFLIGSINQRQQTIFRIASEIVRIQKDFLDHGISQLKPLTMSDVADILGIHETTVSRAVSGKYMQTPRGVFDMKSFFTQGVKSNDGTSISNATIKDTLQQLIAEEDSLKPLSDSALVKMLKAKNMNVARRTVAKYRDQLKIPPSHLRKSF